MTLFLLFFSVDIAVRSRGEVCPMPYAHGGLCPMPYARRNMLLRKAISIFIDI